MGVAVGLFAVAVLAAVAAVVLGVRARRGAASGAATGGASGLAGGAAVVAVLVAAAGVVVALVLRGATQAGVDDPVLDWVLGLRSPAATAVARTLSTVGGTVGTGTVGVVTGLVLLLRGHRARALVWVLAVGAGSLTIRLVKLALDRPRPPLVDRLDVETTTSLPSGHALMAALGLGLLALAVVRTTRGPVRAVVPVVAVVLAAAIGASRVYLGVHWTTDVITGWLLGAALAVLADTVARALADRPGAAARPTTGAPTVTMTSD